MDIMGRTIELCENSARGTAGLAIITPQCWGNEATHEVKVAYSEVEEDVLHLCLSCAQKVKRDARKHKYQVKMRRIRAGGERRLA